MLKPSDTASSNTAVSTSKPGYRGFLLGLNRMFKEKDLKEFKFALKDVIPARSLEGLHEPLDVFSALEDRGLLGPDKFDELRGFLEEIDRPKMVDLLDDFDDAGTKFPLKPRSDNRLEKDGYSVSVEGGRHFDTSQGEFVEVRSGSNYSLTLINNNTHRCLINIQIDGYEMFPNGLIFAPKQIYTIERPSRIEEKFKFFAIRDAPDGSGINGWRKHENGVIEVKFTPERAGMKITCVAPGLETRTVSCSTKATDVAFLEMVARVFDNAVVTVMINSWKPLGKRGVKLTWYGVRDGSRVIVNVGGVGGGDPRVRRVVGLNKGDATSKKNADWTADQSATSKPKADGVWRAGATTLEGKSDQKFRKELKFPTDPSRASILNLRLVARENVIPLPSTGNPTPLTRATLIPPPVPN
ncbi:uncharacterized protein LOC114522594 [Dendronephthya gigantea]|uniref:uncharacterized protein LOC114522594 n=1 Tax=Dendronephthya gigantea TaxID=151771 RepID=UPI00106BEA2E|nr:uncharacterized protein LOC114522594 [Dendronephthya gigantea]